MCVCARLVGPFFSVGPVKQRGEMYAQINALHATVLSLQANQMALSRQLLAFGAPKEVKEVKEVKETKEIKEEDFRRIEFLVHGAVRDVETLKITADNNRFDEFRVTIANEVAEALATAKDAKEAAAAATASATAAATAAAKEVAKEVATQVATQVVKEVAKEVAREVATQVAKEAIEEVLRTVAPSSPASNASALTEDEGPPGVAPAPVDDPVTIVPGKKKAAPKRAPKP